MVDMAGPLDNLSYGLSSRNIDRLLELVDELREIAREEPAYAEELVLLSVQLESVVRPAKPSMVLDTDLDLEFVEEDSSLEFIEEETAGGAG